MEGLIFGKKADAGLACGDRAAQERMGCGAGEALPWQAAHGQARDANASDLTVSAARCKVDSNIRDAPNQEPGGRDTFRTRPAPNSNARDTGENANLAGVVHTVGSR